MARMIGVGGRLMALPPVLIGFSPCWHDLAVCLIENLVNPPYDD